MSTPTGTQLLCTASDLAQMSVQLKLYRYQAHVGMMRSRLSRALSGVGGPYRVDWPCPDQGNFISAGMALGLETMTDRNLFENQLRESYRMFSRTKLNNMKRDEGKTALDPYP